MHENLENFAFFEKAWKIGLYDQKNVKNIYEEKQGVGMGRKEFLNEKL